MAAKYNEGDKLAYFSSVPDVGELQNELERSLYNGGNVARINSNDDIRLCRWEGQSDDGKKYQQNLREGESVFPFEGASDVRVRLVDSIINELTVLCVHSWQRAALRVSGTEVGDALAAGAVQTLTRYMVENRLRMELEREAELWAQNTFNYGWSVVHVGWERKLGSREVTLTMPIVEAKAQEQGGILAEAVRSMSVSGASDLSANLLANAYSTTVEEGRRMAKELLESGTTTFRESRVVRNQPVVAALRPFDEICFPPETLDLQDARVIFRRTFMTEVELREMIKTEGWDEKWVEEAALTAGKSAWYADPNLIPTTTNITDTLNRADNLIEVVYAYTRQIGENGTPCIYYTVFCPHTQEETFAKHEMLDYAHGEYPFVEFRRERMRRAVSESRGIPELAMTDQEEIKAQHDSVRDRTAFETLPPLKVKKRLGTQNQIAPGVLLPVTTPDDYQFLSPPSGNPGLAFNLIDRVEAKVAAYFGLTHPAVPPVKTQMQQQFLVNNWLTAWSRVYRQMTVLCVQYMDGAEIERIAGVPVAMEPADLSSTYDINVAFNVRELDSDHVLEKMKAIQQFVLPMDTSGAVDRSALVRTIVEAISPEASKTILLDQAAASQRMYTDVQTDIAKMMLGMEPAYVENDPAAGSKLQYAQDILQKNQKAQQAAQADPQFQALLQNYLQNLQMSVSQQQNKQVGRIGVTPVSDKMAQQQQGGGY